MSQVWREANRLSLKLLYSSLNLRRVLVYELNLSCLDNEYAFIAIIVEDLPSFWRLEGRRSFLF
jgi:hypothetical protein